jgi:hypothetical protein
VYTGIETIYLIHHSHTDIGYTHDQPVVWDLHRRFIDAALDRCERDADGDADHAFRWTVETTAMLLHWLRSAPDRQVARFVDLARGGRIEVTGMFLNVTPLMDADQLVETLAPLRTIRDELGLPVRHAMNSDVNGQNWPLVDVLLEAGIDAFSMATNIHFGGSPLAWPTAFHWQGPSGRTILAWNGWDYGFARDAGVDEDPARLRDETWPRIDRWLRERDYPLPVLMLQFYDAFGDNGSASATISAFVRAWNETVGRPRLRIALPGEWWAAVRAHGDQLPTHRGDWTDYWNFGCGSSAREVAINRRSRTRLRAADAAAAALDALGGNQDQDPTRRALPGTRQQAWENLILFDEHTWGADCSIWRPDDEDTVAQWNHNAAYAYRARSLSHLLARDALAELARRVERAPGDAFLVFNPLPFPRVVAGPLPRAVTAGVRGQAGDPTAARHWADRHALEQPITSVSASGETTYAAIAPTEIPAYGYAVVSADAVRHITATVGDEDTVVTEAHRLVFDRNGGGIRSWYSTRLGRELVDGAAGWPLGGWVYEAPVADAALSNPRRAFWAPVERRLGLARGWRPGWAATRRGPQRVLDHRVERRADGITVAQRLALPAGGELVQHTYIPLHAAWIECTSTWDMGLQTTPEATYIAFPFALPGATARVDLGGQAMRVDDDQLPRACRDYYTAQGWVDVSTADCGVTVACPDAPMVQIGAFAFGANRETVDLDRALVLGWVTNNYWETNFRAHQPGVVSTRYCLLPHAGPFDEQEAHRFGAEAAAPPLFQPLWEPAVAQTTLPRAGSLLRLPDPPVLTVHVLPDGATLRLRLLNASDAPATATVGSSLLRIVGAARSDLLGSSAEELATDRGLVTVAMGSREMVALCLSLRREPGCD